MLNRSPVSSNQQVKPSFLWWRFAALTIALMVAAYLFYWYYEPTPTRAQQLVFDLILAAILTQTMQAGWYRGNDPWEIRFLDFLLTALVVIVGVALAIFVIFILLSTFSDGLDPRLFLILVFLVVIGALLMLAVFFDRDRP